MMDVLEKREEQVSLRKEGRKGEGKEVESMCCCGDGEFLLCVNTVKKKTKLIKTRLWVYSLDREENLS